MNDILKKALIGAVIGIIVSAIFIYHNNESEDSAAQQMEEPPFQAEAEKQEKPSKPAIKIRKMNEAPGTVLHY